MTRYLVPTEPNVQELKFYAPGRRPGLTVHTEGAGGRAVLLAYSRGGQPVANVFCWMRGS
jgi:hypothetical protein